MFVVRSRERSQKGSIFLGRPVVNPTMPKKLSDEKIDQILEAYDDLGSLGKVAQEVGVSKATVKKYVERNRDESEDEAVEPEHNQTPGAVVEMSGTDSNLADLTDDELMSMSESEFIRTFFQEFSDTGVKDSFIELIANQAKVRQQIPDEDQMAQRIQSHNSGVGNANDANAIAELYWALAQRYLRARGMSSAGQMGSMMGGMGSSGQWVGSSGHTTQPQQQQSRNSSGSAATDGGDWVSTAPQQGQGVAGMQQPGQQSGGQMQQMAQMFQQMQQQQQQMMERMMAQQQNGQKDKLEEKIERLEGQLSSGSSSPTESLQEYVELQETLEQLNKQSGGGGETEQLMASLQHQIQALQQEVSESGNNSMEMMSQTDSELGLLVALAQSGQLDASDVSELAQQFGQVETHPEVAQKKYDKEIEEMKVRAEQEKWESILNGVEGLTQNLGGAFTALLEDEEEAEPQQSGRARTAAKENPDVVEADVVGDNPPEHSDGQEESPAKRLVDAGGSGGGSGGGDAVEDDDSGDDEADSEDSGVVCECGKGFDTKQQLNGHKVHCDEAE